ncbi:DUF29 family protein, partial [Geminocystis sp. GBBB08]
HYYLSNKINLCYQDGRIMASKHSQLSLDRFPKNPIASLEQILDENWLP